MHDFSNPIIGIAVSKDHVAWRAIRITVQGFDTVEHDRMRISNPEDPRLMNFQCLRAALDHIKPKEAAVMDFQPDDASADDMSRAELSRLSHVRGAVLEALAEKRIPIHYYSPQAADRALSDSRTLSRMEFTAADELHDRAMGLALCREQEQIGKTHPRTAMARRMGDAIAWILKVPDDSAEKKAILESALRAFQQAAEEPGAAQTETEDLVALAWAAAGARRSARELLDILRQTLLDEDLPPFDVGDRVIDPATDRHGVVVSQEGHRANPRCTVQFDPRTAVQELQASELAPEGPLDPSHSPQEPLPCPTS